MRVNIEHVEQKTGLIRKTIHYVVQCSVDFSEEEKQIIKQRKLEEWVIMRIPLDSRSDKEAAAKYGFTDDAIKIDYLIQKKPYGHGSSTPAEAKTYELDLTEALKKLKVFIDNNAEITEKSHTFEL